MSCFTDSIVVVTGGGSGIGAALAQEAVKRGARVAVGDIQRDSAAAVADSMTTQGGNARPYQVDVTSADSVQAFARDVLDDFGAVNIVFANAGVIAGGALGETKPADFAWMYDVNVTGMFLTVQAFLPALLAAAAAGRAARIVTTGSENSLGLPIGFPTTAYTGTKHAVLGLSDGLRRDLAEHGVKVSVICPGMVATNLADAKSRRQAQYGGAESLPPEQVEMVNEIMKQHARLPAETAWLGCEGIEHDEFMIITDPGIRALAELRHRDVMAALEVLERRLAR